MNVIFVWGVVVDDYRVGQAFRHCHKPGAFLSSERILVNSLHHRVREAGAVAEYHVGICPFELKYVAQDYFESWSSRYRPPKSLLI